MDKDFFNMLANELISIRRHFHLNPELSFKEYKTSKFIKEYLDKIGLEPRFIGGTGVVATIFKSKEYKTIAIRAEIDALPIQEETGREYASNTKGVMHACSHDAIAATALCLAKLIKKYEDNLRCNVKFIFEPAEEIGEGSRKLISEGVLENPKVDEIIFFHYTNEAKLGMDMQKHIVSGTVGSFNINIKGKASHWSYYENGIDAIKTLGKVLSLIDNINENHKLKNPFILGSGKVYGGDSKNIVAENVNLEGTLRTYTLSDYFEIVNVLKEGLKYIEKVTKTKIDMKISENPIPPMYNSQNLLNRAFKVGSEVFKNRCTITDTTYLSADNASFYLESAKGLFIAFFDKEDEKTYPLHNSKFDFNERVMPYALKVLYKLIINSK